MTDLVVPSSGGKTEAPKEETSYNPLHVTMTPRKDIPEGPKDVSGELDGAATSGEFQAKTTNKIDFSFLSTLEGGQKLVGYQPTPNSGVTGATAFDLKERSYDSLIAMGAPAALATKLDPFTGLSGKAAKAIASQLILTKPEADILDRLSRAESLIKVPRDFKTLTGLDFHSLTPAQQTVVFTKGFQYGNLSRMPKFMAAFKEGNIQKAVDELANFGEKTKGEQNRSKQESDYLSKEFNRVATPSADIKLAAAQVVGTTPQQAAADLKTSKETGLPVDMVQSNRKFLEDQKKIQKLTNVTPASATEAAVSTADKLSVAQTSLEALEESEWATRLAAATAGGFVRAGGDTLFGLGLVNEIASRGMSRPVANLMDAMGMQDLRVAMVNWQNQNLPWWANPSNWLKSPGETLQAGAKALTPDNPSWIEEVAGGIGQVGAQWAMAIMSGGFASVVSQAALAGQGISQQAAASKKAGKTGDSVDLAALLGGGVTAVTERYGLNIIFNKLPASLKSRWIRILQGAGTEAAQELLEQLGQNLVQLGLVNEKQAILEGVDMRTATVSGTVGGIISAFLPGKHKAVKAKKAADVAVEAVADSEVQELAPEIPAEVRAEALKEGGISEVQIPVEAIVTWAEDAEDTAALYEELGIADQMEAALARNADVNISGHVLASTIMGSPRYSKIADHIKFNESLPTADQAIAEIEENAGAVEQLLKDGDHQIEETLAKRVEKWMKNFSNPKEGADLQDLYIIAPLSIREAVDELIIRVKQNKAEFNAVIREARLNQIGQEGAALDTQIEAKADEIEQRKADEKPVVKATKQLEKLIANKDKLDQEQELLEIPDQVAALRPEFQEEQTVDKKVQVTTKAGKLEALEVKTTGHSISVVKAAFKQGMSLAKTNVKQAQKVLHEIVKQSGLSRHDQSFFTAAITNLSTTEQLEKQLPVLQARILNKLRKERQRVLKKALKGVLKKNKIKRLSGKPESKVGPEVTKLLQTLGEMLRVDPATARSELSRRQDIGAGEDISPTHAIENTFLSLAAGEDVNVTELENTLLDLSAIVDEGKAVRAASQLALLQRQVDATNELLDLLPPEPTRPITKSKAKEFYDKWILSTSGAWWMKLQRVIVSKDGVRTNRFIDSVSLTDESILQEENKQQMLKKWESSMTQALGMTPRQLLIKHQQDALEEIELGTFTLAPVLDEDGDIVTPGKVKTLIFSRSELRQRHMEMLNDDLRELAMQPETEGYTQEVLDAIRDALLPQDHIQVRVQLEWYNEYYDRINEVYERVYGMSLPKLDQYVPISREGQGIDQDEFMKSVVYRGGVVPENLKSRTPSKLRLVQQGDYSVMAMHMIEMEYFIAFKEKTLFMNNVFNADVMNRIKDNYGESVRRTIADDLGYFSNKAIITNLTIERDVVKLMRNFGFAALSLKPQIGLKQLVSLAAMNEDVKTVNFVAGIVYMAAHPKKAIAILNKSLFFKNRGSNIDQDYQALQADMLSGKFINFLGRNPNVLKVQMALIRWGDKGAIAIGGFGHIHAKMKEGASEADAIKSFEKISNRTQQSTNPDQLSELQRSSGFVRILVQFMSSPNAIARAEISAINEVLKGRISKKEFTKRYITTHFVIPAMIMWIANGFSWDDEDEIAATAFGSLNGLFVIGDVFEEIQNAALGAPYDALGARHILAFVKDFKKMVEGLIKEDWDDIFSVRGFFEGSKALDGALGATSALTGVSAEQYVNAVRGFERIGRGPKKDLKQGTALSLGWSPYVIKKNRIGSE